MTKDVLPKLAAKAALSILHKLKKKVSGKGAVGAGKGFTLFISNEDMNNIIKIRKSLEKSGLLIEGATETVKHEKEGACLWDTMAPMAGSLVVHLAY